MAIQACLNTFLRAADPPIFCSRTCRVVTIKGKGKYEPEGKAFVQDLALSNARDLPTLIRWNERYGIRFLRISSEMFPFASHKTYGYTLDFAAEYLREAGALAMQWGHRLTTHPGQFTQLGAQRFDVANASVREIEYHK